MDGKREGEGEEAMEWELLHHHNNNNDDEGVDELGPRLDSCALIRPDYFSLHPPPTPTATAVVSSDSSSSSTDPNEVDRNFDDSYLADQLFPYLHQQGPQFSSSSSAASSNNPPLSNDSDSDSDSKAILLPQTTSASTAAAAAGGGALDSKEEEEEHESDKEVMKEEEERRVVWWKVPLEVFRYWVVRVTPAAAASAPAWSLSVAAAAAFLGLLFLGRRLYKMKRKTQTLKLNLALDDKKVSQLMGRVARLNEAFSVVRRVPIVRPSLPAPSVTLRPVMSIR